MLLRTLLLRGLPDEDTCDFATVAVGWGAKIIFT
jgi:hypothetical protein